MLRTTGLLWLAAWALILVFMLRLWSTLGGCVDERVRWWARLGLLAGPVVGFAAGAHARDLARWGRGHTHAELLRWLWMPPAILAVLAALRWTLAGMHDEARVVLGTFVGYWAGFDTAMAAWPLACGRAWRFLRDIPPEQIDEGEESGSAGEGWI